MPNGQPSVRRFPGMELGKGLASSSDPAAWQVRRRAHAVPRKARLLTWKGTDSDSPRSPAPGALTQWRSGGYFLDRLWVFLLFLPLLLLLLLPLLPLPPHLLPHLVPHLPPAQCGCDGGCDGDGDGDGA